MHKPGELSAAAKRVDFGKHEDIFHEMGLYLAEKGEGPQILFFSASHVNHLETYVPSQCSHEGVCCAFKNAHFIGVGGSSWDHIEEHVQGHGFMNPKPDMKDK